MVLFIVGVLNWGVPFLNQDGGLHKKTQKGKSSSPAKMSSQGVPSSLPSYKAGLSIQKMPSCLSSRLLKSFLKYLILNLCFLGKRLVRLVGGNHAFFLAYVFASVTAVPTCHMVSSLSSSACVKHPLCWLLYLVNKVFSIALLRKYVKLFVTYASLLQHLCFAFACGS